MKRVRKVQWADDDSIYNPDMVGELLDEDELTPEEEAFMMGYAAEYTEEKEDYY